MFSRTWFVTCLVATMLLVAAAASGAHGKPDEPDVKGVAGDWMDDFDTYATGQDMHGVGGWKGWDNNPAFTAFTSDTQAQSAPNSLAIVGNNDPVREFAGISGGQWTLTAWQYISSAFIGTSYFIVLNTYNDGGTKNWSVQVAFNGGTNQLVNDGISGGSLSIVRDQWVRIEIDIDLDADTQSFFYNDALLYTGTWSGQVSGGGATSIGAINLFANSAAVVFYDDLSLIQVPIEEFIFGDGFEEPPPP
jgi:hypothetical protein